MSRSLADVLREALVDADRRAVRSPTIDRLNDADLLMLSSETLAFLRTRPSSPSPIPGWQQVRSFDAGVNPWWNGLIGSSKSSDTAARLRKLREQIYDYLDDELGLISKAPGQLALIHISQLGDVPSTEHAKDALKEIFIGSNGAGFGDPAVNQLVESAAMRKTIEHFAGWKHQDVSMRKLGWDITFTQGDVELHVEVKGVSGRRPSVLLTRNELERAVDDPLWSLAVVTQALIAPVVHCFDREAVVGAASPYVYRADFDQD